MKFSEAMKLLEEGKKVKIKTWDNDCYIQLIGNDLYDQDILIFEIEGRDIVSEWEEYIEPETKKIEKMERKNIIGALETIDKINEIIDKLNELEG